MKWEKYFKHWSDSLAYIELAVTSSGKEAPVGWYVMAHPSRRSALARQLSAIVERELSVIAKKMPIEKIEAVMCSRDRKTIRWRPRLANKKGRK
jgi:hypothetical protein